MSEPNELTHPLTCHLRADGTPLDLAAYRACDGYQGLAAANQLEPSAIVAMVKASNLRGRGGAGFPTGMKWSVLPMGPDAPKPKYIAVNADEMEPGTFKDRLLMEQNPHLLLEGIAICARAVEAETAYIFLRGEYTLCATRLRHAIAEANAAQALGNVHVYLHTSAGRYMCGEETGMLNALEGKRANPRTKPPYPGISGLWGKPTVVNNVETLCNVPAILRHGAEWYQKLSRTTDGGTKIYGVSGRVKRPGLWELPMGTTVGEILDLAGGMQDGLKLRGLLPGGASTAVLTPDHLDVAMDFSAPQKVGSRMGTGTMIILDDRACLVGVVANLIDFFSRESCGWCTPCWSGLGWASRLLDAMEAGKGQPGDIEKLEHLASFWGPGATFCALAPGAADPLRSCIQHFRQDFEDHIREHRCPHEGWDA
ncbi:MAG: NADH-quinone oxidoreductase subunit F [Acidobacteria bacterium]|nr:MAG: NADH-quinone oxidoreductase subunit F [Acidobacteriota bacterium]